MFSCQACDRTYNTRHLTTHIFARDLGEETLRQQLQLDDSILKNHFRDVTTIGINVQ